MTAALDRRTHQDKRLQLLRAKEFDSAITLQKEAIARNPSDAKLMKELAWTYSAAGRLDEAIAAQVQAFALAPKDSNLARALSRLFERKAVILDREHEASFKAEQRKKKAAIRRTLLQVIREDLRNWPSHAPKGEVFVSADLMEAHLLDAVADWMRYAPEPCEPGDIVDVQGVGRFHVANPSDVIHKRLARGIAWEMPIVALLRELVERCNPSSAFVEVGANVGAHVVPTALHFSGRVIAFEPVKATFEKLNRNLEINEIKNVTCVRKACSSAEGAGRMIHINQANTGLAQLQLDSGEGELVETTTLSKALDKLGVKLGVLKIDVEGHEQGVIDGAEERLRTDRPLVICELLGEAAAKSMVERMEKLKFRARKFFRSDWLFAPEAPGS